MSIGDVLNPKRVRTQANERLDTGDAQALSQASRDHLDAYSRAIEALPRNVGGATPTGLIFTGFGLTLNPTGPNDNKVRVQSPVGVAFDANGRMLIKENGTTVDLTLGAGNSQVYAYYIEDNSDSTTRRFITVTSPYAEGPQVIPTKLKGDVGYWVRTGDQTTIVASDVVNGQTTALCFLGVANNAAGAITMTGYDVVTAPNGAYATNRLTSVVQPTTPPPANTANGSVAHILGLLHAALYEHGKAVWGSSNVQPPTQANNFGAYTEPTGRGLQDLGEVPQVLAPVPVFALNWAAAATALVGPHLASSGAGDAYFDLLVPAGRSLRSLVVSVFGNGANTLDVQVVRTYRDATNYVVLQAQLALVPGAAWSDVSFTFAGIIDVVANVTVVSGSFTFTRAAGSYLTDNFAVGMVVSWTGFVNAGNNLTNVTITALTALVMTVSAATTVNETHNATVQTNDARPGPGDNLQLRVNANGAGLRVKGFKRKFSSPKRLNVGPLQLNIVAIALTVARLTGSWLTDGAYVGMSLTLAGFANGGNNNTFVVTSIVDALTLTLGAPGGLVNETGSGTQTAVGDP
jgi:hypothetical protein